MDIVQRLRAVLATLCQIEVKGRANLDYLLACIKAVEAVLQELSERGDANAADQHD